MFLMMMIVRQISWGNPLLFSSETRLTTIPPSFPPFGVMWRRHLTASDVTPFFQNACNCFTAMKRGRRRNEGLFHVVLKSNLWPGRGQIVWYQINVHVWVGVLCDFFLYCACCDLLSSCGCRQFIYSSVEILFTRMT